MKLKRENKLQGQNQNKANKTQDRNKTTHRMINFSNLFCAHLVQAMRGGASGEWEGMGEVWGIKLRLLDGKLTGVGRGRGQEGGGGGSSGMASA